MDKTELVRMCNYTLQYKDSPLLTPMVEHQIVNDAFILARELLHRLKVEKILTGEEYPIARNNGAACG